MTRAGPFGRWTGPCVQIVAAAALVFTVACGAEPPPAAGHAFVAPEGAVALPVEVRFTGTQVIVGNTGEGLWTDVVVELARGAADGPYRYRADGILGGRSITVGALNFEKSDGTRLSPFAGPPTEWAVTARLPDGRPGFAAGRFE